MTEASLALVPNDDDVPSDDVDVPEQRTSAKIPDFEGEKVVATKAKITSVAGLEIGDRAFRMDESVKMIVDARVVGVQHQSNAKGELERVHTLKAIDSLVVSWDMDMDALKDALASD